jgi:L-ascorbate metabolism protein UlaG (beta-lactamase superfamily)
VRLINPDVTISIHYDNYDEYLSPLGDFKKAIKETGLSGKVVYLDREDRYESEIEGGK